MNTLPVAPGYQPMIERAAQDPNFDLDKFERLVSMQDAQEQRAGDRQFNEALSAAQAEMAPISANAHNPQTRSRYATFAQLDREIRPIYTGHGFGVSFNTEPSGEQDKILVVGWLTQGCVQRRYQLPMPIDTKGARGNDVMTRTHATMSAVSYGKRGLLIMMFNLAIDPDDDGNRAGGYRTPRAQAQAPIHRPPPQVNVPTTEIIDPDTGETIEVAEPTKIEMEATDDFRSWGEKFIGCLRRYTKSIDEVDAWVRLNQDELLRMQENKPQLYKTLSDAVDNIKETFTSGT